MEQAATPCHVLIVEDDAAIGNMLVMLLEAEGYTATLASNGQIALDLLQQLPTQPHLILLDLAMPGGDGQQFRTSQQGNLDWASIPVIVMSAKYRSAALAATMQADGYLAKPFRLDDLLAIVTRFCSSSNSTIPGA